MIVVCSILPVAKLAAASLIGQRLLARKETPAAFPAYCTLCLQPSPRTVFHPELQHEEKKIIMSLLEIVWQQIRN